MIHVALATDAAYLPHAAAALASLKARARPFTAHVFHTPEVPAAELERLRSMFVAGPGTLRLHTADPARLRGLPDMGRIPAVMWYRLFLPELLPEAERVLYLDCDTLVVDDPRPLWDTDLQGRATGAVRNVFEAGAAGHARALGLSDYFNSGVLLMDLRAWRAAGLTQRVLEAAAARRLTWPDQDALNLALAGRWLPLHPRWNAQNSVFFFPHARDVLGADAVREATRQPAILHFEGGALAKPWHYLCKHPRRAEYFRHRAATPWPEVAIEGRSPLNALLRPLPLRVIVAALRAQDRAGRLLRGRP